MSGYVKRVLIWIDQGANVLLLGGWPDETISARAWREQWRIRPWIDRLFFWEPNHCEESYKWELARKDLPRGYDE